MKIDSIRAVAEKYRGSMTGWLGVGFTDLQTGESFSLMGDDEFPRPAPLRSLSWLNFSARRRKAGSK